MAAVIAPTAASGRSNSYQDRVMKSATTCCSSLIRPLTKGKTADELHEKSWMHPKIRRFNMMKSRDDSGSLFLVDFMDAAESLRHSPSGGLLSQNKHAPDIFENNSRSVAGGIWFMGHLLVTFGTQLSGEKFDLGKNWVTLFDWLLERDQLVRLVKYLILKPILN
jgi:hypothetical protein